MRIHLRVWSVVAVCFLGLSSHFCKRDDDHNHPDDDCRDGIAQLEPGTYTGVYRFVMCSGTVQITPVTVVLQGGTFTATPTDVNTPRTQFAPTSGPWRTGHDHALHQDTAAFGYGSRVSGGDTTWPAQSLSGTVALRNLGGDTIELNRTAYQVLPTCVPIEDRLLLVRQDD